MIFLFISFFMFIFKWQRLIFILISLEFLMLSTFFMLGSVLTEMNYFLFMCFSVISSILGMIIMVGNMKYFGSDQCIF